MVKNTLKNHTKEIHIFNKERVYWLRLSGFVAIAILLILADWAFIGIGSVHWVLIGTGLVLSVIWWYWTMKLVRQLLNHRMTEVEILSDIIDEIREVKKSVENLNAKS